MWNGPGNRVNGDGVTRRTNVELVQSNDDPVPVGQGVCHGVRVARPLRYPDCWARVQWNNIWQ
jgi:hypothetical protein